MQRTFVIGDIHGAYLALEQCLKKSHFNFDEDRLICLGDVSDSWPQTKEVVKELLKIKNLVLIQGNHDYWSLQWGLSGIVDNQWLDQGGGATFESYNGKMSKKHLKFFKSALPYFEENDRLFVHGGFDPAKSIAKQKLAVLAWDRSLAQNAMKAVKNKSRKFLTDYAEVYLGHTPIIRLGYKKPICGGGIWLMDTGAGWSGKLSMMNVETKDLFQSDYVFKLYPKYKGRI
jgi:serine/threonine protein phosphatase 1